MEKLDTLHLVRQIFDEQPDIIDAIERLGEMASMPRNADEFVKADVAWKSVKKAVTKALGETGKLWEEAEKVMAGEKPGTQNKLPIAINAKTVEITGGDFQVRLEDLDEDPN